MPTFRVLTFPTIEQEPVTLAQLKAETRVDGTVEDALLGLKLQAARDLCEQYCGRFFAPCTVEATFEIGEPYALDPLAGAATAVRGYYTTLDELTRLTDTRYQAEYLKGISVNRDYPIGGYGYGYGYGYGRGSYEPATFTVTYPVAATPAQVPPAVKQAILKLAAELYENRETSSNAGRDTLLAVSYRTLLAPYTLTNPLHQL